MNRCADDRDDILLFLDGRLEPVEMARFREHLVGCPACREALEQERALTALLKSCRPLYTASEPLQQRIADLLEQQPLVGAPPFNTLRPKSTAIPSLPLRSSHASTGARGSWVAFACAAALIILATTVMRQPSEKSRESEYIATAAAIHRAYVEGDTSLEIVSNSPAEINASFASGLPFEFKLPVGDPMLTVPNIYRLRGARRIDYKGSHAVLVAYERDGENVSLLVANSKIAAVTGGKEVHAGKVTFHYFEQSDCKLVGWTSRGISYALVLPASASAQRACLVCHQDMKDRYHFESATSAKGLAVAPELRLRGQRQWF